MASKLVTVFGGSGFLGRRIVEHLAAAGHDVRVGVRHPDRAAFLRRLDRDLGEFPWTSRIVCAVCNSFSSRTTFASSSRTFALSG